MNTVIPAGNTETQSQGSETGEAMPSMALDSSNPCRNDERDKRLAMFFDQGDSIGQNYALLRYQRVRYELAGKHPEVCALHQQMNRV